MADKPKKNKESGLQPPIFDEASAVPATASITIDWEFYAHHLAESDLTDAEKQDFIETVIAIAKSFMDLGFGVHAKSLTCEQNPENVPLAGSDMLSSMQDIPNNQTQATDADALHPARTKEES